MIFLSFLKPPAKRKQFSRAKPYDLFNTSLFPEATSKEESILKSQTLEQHLASEPRQPSQVNIIIIIRILIL